MTIAARILTLALALSAGTAHAKPPESASRQTDTKHYDFDDDLVQGELLRPDEGREVFRSRTGVSSLIELRTTFVPELLKSVENY